LCRAGLRHHPDDQPPGHHDFHGRTERQYGAPDRASRLCAANRPGRAERRRRRTTPEPDDSRSLSRRDEGGVARVWVDAILFDRLLHALGSSDTLLARTLEEGHRAWRIRYSIARTSTL